jgi:AP-3 complex subunit delta-1
VEKLRLEMQRASERLHVNEEVPVKKKKKKVRQAIVEGDEPIPDIAQDEADVAQGEGEVAPIKKKKKKKVKVEGEGEAREEAQEGTVKKKKKKRRVVAMDEVGETAA